VRHEMGAGCGRAEVLTGGASPAGWPPATSWREGSGVVMVPERLVRRWEAVYREYGLASEMVNNSVPGDRAVARHMARASENVAVVWREMAAEQDMPWWSLAALMAAAQAYEHQARDWAARAKHERHLAAGSERRTSYPPAGRPRDGVGPALVEGATDAV
jgi:hypothetical protein